LAILILSAVILFAVPAGLAAFNVLLDEKLINNVKEKEQWFFSLLHHPRIKAVRSRGLMIAVELESFELNKKVIDVLIANGVFTDWFIFAPNCLRIIPPLVITKEEASFSCDKILAALDRNL
jgi:acetylornithine/succinyldiaminopimelate/putrescine aminotransferase